MHVVTYCADAFAESLLVCGASLFALTHGEARGGWHEVRKLHSLTRWEEAC